MNLAKSGSLKQAIQTEANRLGFQLVGVTTPDTPPHFEVYQKWVGDGLQGNMDYLATGRAFQRRADPRKILPQCHSILVLGIRYASSDINQSPASLAPQIPAPRTAQITPSPASFPSPDPSSLSGHIASYAWGTDYHKVLAKRMESLIHFIESQVGNPVANRWYIDTGPIMERDLAQRAGLGWIGKNTCLIHPQLGSCLFIAEILLDLDLEPDAPFIADRCGNCNRCLEACPTSCILPNRTIDSRICISYLTIEYKGVIPLELRPKIGSWIFGCDLCQQVCPWNQRFGSQPIDLSFNPFQDAQKPSLLQEISLTNPEFNEKFRHRAISRVGRDGYLRNVAIALGNLGDPVATPYLKSTMRSDPAPIVRGHAAWALGQIGDPFSRSVLFESLHTENDVYVLKEIQEAIRVSD